MSVTRERTVGGPGPGAQGRNRRGLPLLFHALPRSVALVLLVLAAPVAQAAEIDWKQGRLGHLAAYIGTYRHDRVLDDPEVKAALHDLVGESLSVFRANLAVSAPIDFSNGNLVLTGLAPHQGGAEEAMILIKIYDGTVRAGLLHQGSMTLYAGDTQYSYVPKILRDFLKPRHSRDPLPPGVIWVR